MILKHLISIGIIVSLSLSTSYSQDIVRLKNGTEYKGKIIEQKIGQSISLISFPAKDTLILSLMEIDKIKKDASYVENAADTTLTVPPYFDFHTTKRVNTHLSGSLGKVQRSSSVKIAVMYRILPVLEVGPGIAKMYGNHSPEYFIESTIPITLDLNYSFWSSKKKKLALLGLTSTGLHIPWGRYSTNNGTAGLANGLYLEAGFGIKSYFAKNAGFILGINFQSIHTKSYIVNDSWKENVVDQFYHPDLLIRLSVFF